MKQINGMYYQTSIVSTEQFNVEDVATLFNQADLYKKGLEQGKLFHDLEGKLLAAIFYEPSSRTFGSFIASMQRLGGTCIPVQNIMSSSVSKGESLEDTIKVFANYADVIALRHPEKGAPERASKISSVPILNAGDGIGEHPTQALNDLYTIKQKFGNIKDLHVVFFGELAHYRPVNSLAKLLSLYPGISISFVSPEQVKLNPDTRTYIKNKNVKFKELEDIDEIIDDADVLYVTRVKKEFISEELYKQIQGKYIVDRNLISKMKKESIIMHALPRIGEILPEVDNDPRAVYLKSQIRNGMYIRMALLKLVLTK